MYLQKLFLCFIVMFFTALANCEIIRNSHPQKEYGKAIEFSKVKDSKAAMSLVIENGKLYALEKNGLSIYNIDNPQMPKRMGFVGGMGNVRQLCVRGKTAFLSSRQCGLWSVDVSDEKNPKIISNFDTVEMATGLDVVGDLAVLGHRVYGIQCVDVSNPAEMKHISSLLTDESQSVLYRDGLIFSGDWAGGEITIIDATNLFDLKVLSKMKLDGYGDGFIVRGDTLFASTGQHKKSGDEKLRHGAGHGLDIFDISDPKNPKKLSKTTFPSIYFGPCDYWTPRVSGNYCFASDTINGVFLLDISDASKPKILGNLILPKADPENPNIFPPFDLLRDPKIPQGDPVSSIAIGDGVLYIAGTFTGIYMAKLPKEAKFEERDFGTLPILPKKKFDAAEVGFISSGAELTNPIRAVTLDDDIAYAANVWGGLKVFKLYDDKIELKRVEKIPYVADVKRSGRRLYTAEGQNGIGIYKIISDDKIEEIGRIPVLDEKLNFTQFLWAFDDCDVIAATNAQARVTFFDCSNPKSPKKLSNFFGPQLAYGNYASQKLVKNRYFAINWHCGGNMIFDLKQRPIKMTHKDFFPMCSQTGSVAAFGDVFLTMRCGAYAFLNPENPTPTRELKRLRFPSQDVLIDDVPDDSMISRAMFPKSDFEGLVFYDDKSGRVAVSNRMFQVCRIYDFSNPQSPRFLKKFDIKSHPNVPVFWRGKLVLPCGYSGLLLEK